MKSGVPWNVRGVRREARETAREAARRSGVPLGEWLNQAIIESAIDDGVVPAHLDEGEPDTDPFPFAAMNGRLDELTQQLERLRQVTTAVPLTTTPLPPQPVLHDDLTSQRLADTIGRLDGRLDQLIHEGRAATDEIERRVNAVDRTLASLTRETPPPPPPVMTPPVMKAPAAQLDMRAPPADSVMRAPPAPMAPLGPPTRPYGPNFLDQAIAEITARQRALDAEPAHTPPPPAPAFVPDTYTPPLQPSYNDPVPRSPTQDMSGLEQQLRHITSQIETLRQPPPPSGIEQAIGALRADLAEIARTLTDALPRRAVESLEGEVRALAARVDESRHSGVDNSTLSTLSGIERGLAEVRDALRGLTPAESLVGLGSAVNALSQKIDLISATHHDPGALAQLEGAISGLRGIVTHVASNDSLTRLQDEVRGLAAKIDRVTSQTGSSDTLNMLEQRIASLADAMENRNQGGELVPPQYDAIVKSLVDKIEKVQLSRGDHMALGHLENRIAQLVERLDASDARFGHLESIERGLVDLLVHLEEMRSASGGNAIRSAPDTKPPVVEALKQDIAALQATTQEKLEDVHGTIEKVVDRLAMIESGMRSQPPPPGPPSPPQPPQPQRQPQTSSAPLPPPQMPAAPQLEPAPVKAQQASQVLPPQAAPQPAKLAPAPLPPPTRAPAPAPQAAPQHVAPPHVAAPRPPIDPDLPPDHPLEPGSRGRVSGSPAERIADSEAALGPAKPPVIADPGGRSNFIAAARRAAQAAAAEMPDRPAYRGEPGFAPATAAGDSQPLSKSLSSRVKMMFSGAGIVLLALGTTYAVSTMLSEPDFDRAAELTEPAPPRRQAALPELPIMAAPPSKAFQAAPLPSAGTLPGGRTNNLPTAGVLSMIAPPAASVLIAPSADRTRPPSAGDVTGSVPSTATVPQAPHPVAAAVPSIVPPVMPPIVASPSLTPSVAALPSPGEEPPAAIGGAILRTAAAKGDAAASYEVAVRFADGTGVPQDFAQAAVWFERAANQGLAPAQFRLGSLYEKGQGVKKDLLTARKLYVSAADQGNAKAMHNLAVLHAEGIEGKPDYKAAAGWFRKAADLDVSDSQYNLGILYARGIGIEVNLAESYKWFSLAARQGDKEAVRKRDDVANRLDPQSLMAAKLAVQTWTPEPQPDAAVNVKTPPGGWERPSASAPAKPKARAAARPVARQEASLAH
ncbi:MAG: Sel1 domain protein repeat-containing protein [Xanthobacteraceae bacterium]|nr:Sel1 domain protein repeat-containing protein [Xanthobacteraceae bacterium]